MSTSPAAQIALESAVLGGLINLRDPADVNDLAAQIESHSLVGPRHDLLLRHIVDGATKVPHEPVTTASLATQIAAEVGANRTDLLAWLTELCDNAQGHKSGVAADVDALRTVQTKRAQQTALEPLLATLADPAASVEEVKAVAGSALSAIENTGGDNAGFDLFATMESMWDQIERRKASGGKPEVSTGSLDLDEVMGGCEPGKITVIGARPGNGKTMAGCDLIRAWMKQGFGAVFVSTEMSPQDLMMRMLAAEADVNHERLRWGNFSTDEEARLTHVTTRIMQDWSPLLDMTDNPSITLDQIRAAITRQKRLCEHRGKRFAGFVVDYIQRMVRPPEDRDERQAINTNMVALTRIAKELDCHAVILAQFNRTADSSAPSQSDLKGSGQIEQDADLIWGLQVPSVEDAESPDAGLAFWHCLKDRMSGNGGRRITRVFQGEYMRFRDMSRRPEPGTSSGTAAPTTWGTAVGGN